MENQFKILFSNFQFFSEKKIDRLAKHFPFLFHRAGWFYR